jgi:hypothetical protein
VNLATLLRLAAHAYGTPVATIHPDLQGWHHHDGSGTLYVCAACAATLMARGHSIVPATPLWKGDFGSHVPTCVVCRDLPVAMIVKQRIVGTKKVVDQLAAAFCSELRDTLTPEHLAEAVERNKTIAPGCCATQDHHDANMIMAAAFERVFGREPFGYDETPEGEASNALDTDLWNAAWDLAKASDFSLQEVQP